jgi:N-acylneuraminate cytidylyltransferase
MRDTTPTLWVVIPARAGSRGVPGKNTRPFAGGPSLLERAVTAAEALPAATILVSTDLDRLTLPGAVRRYVVPRPPALATDTAPMLLVMRHLAQTCAWSFTDRIVLLQPSSLPLPGHTRLEAVTPADLASSLTLVSTWPVPDRWHPAYCLDPEAPVAPPPCRQGLPRRVRPNGLFYILNGVTAATAALWQNPTFLDAPCFTIDTPDDWEEADRAYRHHDHL